MAVDAEPRYWLAKGLVLRTFGDGLFSPTETWRDGAWVRDPIGVSGDLMNMDAVEIDPAELEGLGVTP